VKVLLHAGVDVSLPGGLETHLRELAVGLAARGHDVEVFGRASGSAPVAVTAAPDPARYDVLHAHGAPWPRAFDVHLGVVRTLHFCVAAKMRTYVSIGRVRTLVNLANWRAVAEERSWALRPGRIIAVAARVRDDFARLHGLDPARATVIPNGITPPAPGEAPEALRARYGIAPATRVLLTIGRDDFVKGYDLLARARARAGAAARDALWVTVGGAKPARAPGRLVTGPVPHREVQDWIRAADAGALPSYYEGCSVALLEMLAGGLFTLAHDVGNAADVIRPGANGEIVPRDAGAWAEALERALARPRGRVLALGAEFHWSAVVERTERVYRAAIAARNAAS
jgi:glycosyltransferase involved in cell wall biosynthesis